MTDKWSLIDGDRINAAGFKWATSLLQGKHIVIADDNNSVLRWLKFTLEDYGTKVYIFEHGRDTIDFLSQHMPIDVLILDIIMNEIGGLEIAAFSKANLPNTPILFLTGCQCTSNESVEASQFGTVIQKPVGLEDMISNIMTAIEPSWEKQYLANA